MIVGDAIEDLIRLLDARGVLLYHACQYVDFLSYLSLGGIPSRGLLEGSNQSYTAFETDRNDRDNGVWDKVFVNLTDFGRWWFDRGSGTPNPYGPILLKLRPAALREAEDVAICLRSAGARGFQREQSALKSIGAVDKLFVHPRSAEFPQSTYIKFREQLRTEYQDPAASVPEISCAVGSGRLSIKYVQEALVDPYEMLTDDLHIIVADARDGAGARFRVRERTTTPARRAMLDRLALLILQGELSLRGLIQHQGVGKEIRDWGQRLLAQQQGRQLEDEYRRFATYLREGTLLPLFD